MQLVGEIGIVGARKFLAMPVLGGLIAIWCMTGCAPKGDTSGHADHIRWVTASASFNGDSANTYSYRLSAERDFDTGAVTAHLRGPVKSGGVYSNVFFVAVERPASHPSLDIDDDLGTAELDADVTVEWCTDDAGDALSAGCPIGKSLHVGATWTGGKKMEKFQSVDDGNVNKVRGRLTAASARIGDDASIRAAYAEIVENVTDLPTSIGTVNTTDG